MKYLCGIKHQIAMDYDISQPVSQGGFGAQDAENRRIEAIANELRRRCELYEAQRGDSQPYVSPFEAEQRVAEAYAPDCHRHLYGST
jgi:hypothetical protein